jgi:hypothetical protein
MPDVLDDLVSQMTKRQQKDIVSLIWIEAVQIRTAERKRLMGPPQRKALGLLRSLLTDTQRSQLARSRNFRVEGSLGGVYRLWPKNDHAHTEQVERHKTRWYVRASFCYHDPENELPPADVSIAHLLLISADEGEFLAKANKTLQGRNLWNGAYLRRLNEVRRNPRVSSTREAGQHPYLGEALQLGADARAVGASQEEADAIIADAIALHPEVRAAFRATGTPEPVLLCPDFPGPNGPLRPALHRLDLDLIRDRVPPEILHQVRV